MGHYMTRLEETNDEYKFPSIESSIIPLVWLKNGLGDFKMVIRFSKEDHMKQLKDLTITGTRYEMYIANEIIQALNDSYDDEILLHIELSTSAGKLFYKMLQDILPSKAEFPNKQYTITHSHYTVPTKVIDDCKE